MRKLLLLVLLACPTSLADTNNDVLPELRSIHAVTLSPSYSCRSKEDFQKGYQGTALFASDFARRRNSPDLLFNGACRSEDYFEASTAGENMSLIADLGPVALESLNAQLALNTRVNRIEDHSRFSSMVPVREGHTYAVLLNKSEVRGLLLFTVDSYTPNKAVKLRYAALEYQLVKVAAESPGFAWDKTPIPPGAPI